MNILFFSSFPINKNEGGVQQVTYLLAQSFKSKGFGVFYMCLGDGESGIQDGIKQYFLPNTKSLTSPESIYFAKQVMENNSIDFIINQTGFIEKYIEFLNVVKSNQSKLITVHHNCISCLQDNYRNIILGNSGRLSKIFKYFDYNLIWAILKFINKLKYRKSINRVIKYSDKLVLLSPKFEDELISFITNWDSSKISSIPNPIAYAPQEISPSSKENRLLYIGRIEVSQKQIDVLIRIWASLHNLFPDWHLDILGDGSKLNEMKTLSSELKCERIYFHGFEQPESFLKRAKFLLSTSAFEGFGMVLAEAQAFGVVPISFNSFSAINDVIHENSGVIVPINNEILFIKELSLLMKDEDRRKAYVDHALKNSANFQVNEISDKWIQLFNSIS